MSAAVKFSVDRPRRSPQRMTETLIAAVLALGVLVYLVYTLLRPEKF
jgi:K+-transporting ATPase KdpF subunit